MFAAVNSAGREGRGAYVVESLFFLTSMFVFSLKRLAFPFEDYKHCCFLVLYLTFFFYTLLLVFTFTP